VFHGRAGDGLLHDLPFAGQLGERHGITFAPAGLRQVKVRAVGQDAAPQRRDVFHVQAVRTLVINAAEHLRRLVLHFGGLAHHAGYGQDVGVTAANLFRQRRLAGAGGQRQQAGSQA